METVVEVNNVFTLLERTMLKRQNNNEQCQTTSVVVKDLSPVSTTRVDGPS